MTKRGGLVAAVRAGTVMIALAVQLAAGCATTGIPGNMTHPDYSGTTLVTERKLAIDRCQRENTSTEFVAYENEAASDTARGLAQQGRRVSRMAAFNEAVVACMRRNGWTFQ